MSRAATRSILLCLVLGGLLLSAGCWLAARSLPGWERAQLAAREDFSARFDQLAQQADAARESEAPRVVLSSRRRAGDPRAQAPGGTVADEVLVVVSRRATRGDDASAGELLVGFSPAGEPRLVHWTPRDTVIRTPGSRARPDPQDEAKELAGLLVEGDREVGEGFAVASLASSSLFFPVVGPGAPEYVEIFDPSGAAISAFRRAGTLEDARRAGPVYDIGRELLVQLPRLAVFVGVAGLFLGLLARRRLGLAGGILLAAAAFVSLFVASLPWDRGLLSFVEGLAGALLTGVWVLLLWSAGESWLRSTDPGFSSSFDALRTGRLGPRGGRALLCGLGLGAALAGVRLALLAVAEALPGTGPAALAVPLPVFGAGGTPLSDALRLAALVLLAAAVARRYLPRRWSLPAAALAAALVASPAALRPVPAGIAAGMVVTGGLLAVFRRFELTGLLAASLALHALPAAVYAGGRLDWMSGSFALTTGAMLGLAVLGAAGLGRPREEEERRMGAPAFVRRLEEERRRESEMSLLARMQLGLLPRQVPRLDGWQISARSLLATEVGGDLYDFTRDARGRLWIAAGDVSGHGYSCAIVHAMTKAALVSLVDGERPPSEVLAGVDRVLRSVRFERAFTSLALLRLDPATGEGLLANAGHPYPLLWNGAEVGEVDLPGLPLGQGPPRRYEDRPLHLAPGAVLVFCSDGLFESPDRELAPYGFERPRELLASAARWPSNEIVDMILADWRRHRGAVAAPDDTTVLVVKRLTEEERT